jgi:hypothetical protein
MSETRGTARAPLRRSSAFGSDLKILGSSWLSAVRPPRMFSLGRRLPFMFSCKSRPSAKPLRPAGAFTRLEGTGDYTRSKAKCHYLAELGHETLVWARGRNTPLAGLRERMCPAVVGGPSAGLSRPRPQICGESGPCRRQGLPRSLTTPAGAWRLPAGRKSD